MTKFLSLIGIAVSVLLATNAADAATNLVQNGSFEQTTLASSGALTNNNLPGWTVQNSVLNYTALYFSPTQADTFGATGTGDPDSNWIMRQTAYSPDGGKFVAIDGDPTYRSRLNQTITGLIVGHSYDLSFYYAGAQDIHRTGPTTDSWQVSLGGQTQTTSVLSNPSGGFTGWFNSTMSFTATSASEILSFLAVGTPTGLPPVSLLDGVSLVDSTPPPVPAVPEPATWASMILGLGVIGFSLRRRSNSNAA